MGYKKEDTRNMEIEVKVMVFTLFKDMFTVSNSLHQDII